ncbi:MAG: serine endopeptidase [Burkholderiaceae bacterium]|nr:serine endopeptidase [Burkholderiaceae bacterium]
MTKSLRFTEKWMRRGLWIVAVVFAGFLIGLGSTVVKDLPKVERQRSLQEYMDASTSNRLHEAIKTAELTEQDAREALEQEQLKHRTAQADFAAARETFNNWLATRKATQLSEQDAELIARTKTLENLKNKERAAAATMEKLEQTLLDAQQAAARERTKLRELQDVAQQQLDAENRKLELRVFLYRLALTLPLLALAGWLFVKKRKSTYWPFVWGFIFFAAFTFFVELVPYLPSYGGYVRYIVGIAITILIGRQAIVSLNRYLEKQKLAEQLPDSQRREELSYDTALARLSKLICPGCERAVDMKNPEIDFCPHCGIGLFNHCLHCNTRKSSFAHFCHACGSAGEKNKTALV